MNVKEIFDTINANKRLTDNIGILQKEPGLYCFFLNKSSNLGIFGKSKQLIYLGISMSLSGRQLKQHLNTGQTGWSTFRRSVGGLKRSA